MRIIAAGSVAVLAVLGAFVVRPTPLADLDSRTCDLLAGWAGPGTQSDQVVVVEIGEKSLEQFGRWPWPRALIGKLTRSILDQGAAVVALDMMFPQEDRGNDGLLAAAIAGQPVVAGYALRFAGGEGSLPCPVRPLPLAIVGPNQSAETAVLHATGAVCSVPAITHAAADNGFLNAGPDRDGVMRHVPLLIKSGGRYYPSLALAAVDLYRPVSALQLVARRRDVSRLRLDSRLIPLETESSLRLRFRGPRRHLPYVSAADVFSGHAPAGLLRGKIAVVGGSAAGIRSPVVTPVDPLFPDVEIQATAIDNLLQGDVFHRPADGLLWELALALLAGTASTLLLAWLRSPWAALATVGLAGAVWVCCAWISSNGTLISPLPATAALACTLPLLTLIINSEEKKKAEQTTKELALAALQSLEVLRDSESRYQRLVENVNDAIIMDDCDGRLLFANRRFRDLFGLHQADIRGVALEQYVAPEWCDQVRDRHMRRMQGETVPDRFEFEGIRSDGTRIWIEALVTPVEEDGRIIGSQAALRDTTERKRMEERYLQAQKMESVGRLAGGVAHDFNNLLTVINGYSSLLLGTLGPGEQHRAELEEIQRAGEQAAELTQKLLAFSRKQLVKPRPVDLNILVAEAEKMFEHVIGEDIELVTHLNPDLGQVIADPGQIHQVLMNLVVNARDAMPEGGSVTVETKNVDSDGILPYVYLGVSDTGTGMSDEVKRHLFEPFFTTKPQGKGTGLGLATVYGIVHQSKGRIEVASEPGRGTTISIYLPRTLPVRPEPSGEAIPTADLRGSETVLVVEDQDAVRQFACTILESYGYRVLQSANGPEALALAAEYSAVIHLLVTDIILPLMDGRVLAEKLKAVRPDMKVLYMSGYSEERIGHSRESEGDLAYLSKPFTSKVLAERVRNVLAAS
jgi:PAS domain S-box-containing protein